MNNAAFIDSQNLSCGTRQASDPWKVDLIKFRFYLKRKYKVNQAFYFLGYFKPELQDMYAAIKSYGYTLIFKETLQNTISAKKGNVDTDIVFEIMKKTFNDNSHDKVVIVSGDGDYFKTVRYLIEKHRLERIIGPDERFMSALYTKKLDPKYYAFLNRQDIKNKLKR